MLHEAGDVKPPSTGTRKGSLCCPENDRDAQQQLFIYQSRRSNGGFKRGIFLPSTGNNNTGSVKNTVLEQKPKGDQEVDV